jgi:Ion channel
MLKALAVGIPIMLLCLAIQAGLTGFSVQYYLRRISEKTAQLKATGSIRLLMAVMLILMLGNLLQIVIWGVVFLWLGEFTELYEAVYHSAVNYASLGYGDIVMSQHRKLLGPLEAVNGVLMCGMTAGVLMGILQAQIKQQLGRDN